MFVLVGAGTAAALTGQSAADTTFNLLALAFAAVMGVWQAHGRERRAAQLSTEHRRAQRYLDIAGTMIVVLDGEGTITRVNRRACEVLGWSEEELVGACWFETVLPDDIREQARATFHRSLAGIPAPQASRAVPVLTRSGERREIAWNGQVVPTSEGQGVVLAGEDVTDQKAAQERAEYMAYHDALTGLANRPKLEEHLALALAGARRTKRSLAVIYIDLDHFKVVNDTLGHGAGDELLRAGRQAALRALPRERPARPSRRRRVHAPAHRHRGRRRRRCRDWSPPNCWPRSRRRSSSRDTSSRSPRASAWRRSPTTAARWPTCSSAPTPRSTPPRATGAGRSASRTGDHDSATARLTLTARLRRALARDELELHYQPVFNVATGEAVAVEALLRWNDPERGMVPPGEFIPGAEDSGLIEPIGDWVVDAVIAQAAEWHAQGLHPDIAFNLSPRQLRSPGFAERLLGRFEAAGADPRQFIAEITESAAMADPEYTLPLLDRLTAAGLRLAIDDFGADFSSLARLRDLPVHELKIDRSFLRGVPNDTRAAAIVTAIIQLAQALELCAVAEGVEELDQLLFLAEHGCALAQGFHLARPMPAAQVTPLLARKNSTTMSPSIPR